GTAWLEGEVRPGRHPDVEQLRLPGGKFAAVIPEREHPLSFSTSVSDLRSQSGPFGGNRPPPGLWAVLPMLGLPLVVAGLLGITHGSPHWFPLLARGG